MIKIRNQQKIWIYPKKLKSSTTKFLKIQIEIQLTTALNCKLCNGVQKYPIALSQSIPLSHTSMRRPVSTSSISLKKKFFEKWHLLSVFSTTDYVQLFKIPIWKLDFGTFGMMALVIVEGASLRNYFLMFTFFTKRNISYGRSRNISRKEVPTHTEQPRVTLRGAVITFPNRNFYQFLKVQISI